MSTQPFNILHSGSPAEDTKNLLAYLDRYAYGLGMESMEVDLGLVENAITGMNNMPWGYGAQAASPFKKVAAFATNFGLYQPILTPFPQANFGEFHKHQNAIVAYNLSVFALHNAVIECPFRGKIPLKNPIRVSRHFWQEFISALSQSNPVEHFQYVSLIFESICYEENPYASYKRLRENSQLGYTVSETSSEGPHK